MRTMRCRSRGRVGHWLQNPLHDLGSAEDPGGVFEGSWMAASLIQSLTRDGPAHHS